MSVLVANTQLGLDAGQLGVGVLGARLLRPGRILEGLGWIHVEARLGQQQRRLGVRRALLQVLLEALDHAERLAGTEVAVGQQAPSPAIGRTGRDQLLQLLDSWERIGLRVLDQHAGAENRERFPGRRAGHVAGVQGPGILVDAAPGPIQAAVQKVQLRSHGQKQPPLLGGEPGQPFLCHRNTHRGVRPPQGQRSPSLEDEQGHGVGVVVQRGQRGIGARLDGRSRGGRLGFEARELGFGPGPGSAAHEQIEHQQAHRRVRRTQRFDRFHVGFRGFAVTGVNLQEAGTAGQGLGRGGIAPNRAVQPLAGLLQSVCAPLARAGLAEQHMGIDLVGMPFDQRLEDQASLVSAVDRQLGPGHEHQHVHVTRLHRKALLADVDGLVVVAAAKVEPGEIRGDQRVADAMTEGSSPGPRGSSRLAALQRAYGHVRIGIGQQGLHVIRIARQVQLVVPAGFGPVRTGHGLDRLLAGDDGRLPGAVAVSERSQCGGHDQADDQDRQDRDVDSSWTRGLVH